MIILKFRRDGAKSILNTRNMWVGEIISSLSLYPASSE
jgi:hypothetical protein